MRASSKSAASSCSGVLQCATALAVAHAACDLLKRGVFCSYGRPLCESCCPCLHAPGSLAMTHGGVVVITDT
jgi:hypothetical protein